MKTVKENLHSLIDTIGDEKLLESVYEILQESSGQGRIWQSLTEQQKQEVLHAAKNLNDPHQLPNSAMIEKNKKWLTK